MKSQEINIRGFRIKCHTLNTLVIGSGAASLNAAVSLHAGGMEDIAIATDQWGGGTSNNAGSDKQTYYKLSLSGTEPDSVPAMARDLFEGRCMHGDIALCEAQGSVQAFMRLAELGVQFPRDAFGAFAGYKTDHDPRSRATSAGPYTSRRMFEVLAGEAIKRGIPVLDNHHCIALLTNTPGTEVIGAVAVDRNESDYKNAIVLFNAVNVVLGTGGPAGIYESSVYPLSQQGSTGMAFLAGAAGQNLTESQFGIASVDFRWNLSGSYQQVIPRYISTDENGNDEKEFLADHFPDIRTLSKAIFLKGYQWPFDPRKIPGYGSSMIDVLVYREIIEKQRKVFLDYRKNPSGRDGEPFSLNNLDKEVENYLKNSGALKHTPYQRLLAMNAPAAALYADHGIDLGRQNLRIAVCAQHNNGGLKGSIWWESDLRHLFPVGEVNGSHGVYRPGGAALNAGQVGSYRAAQFIIKNYGNPPAETEIFLNHAACRLNGILELASSWMKAGKSDAGRRFEEEIKHRMSANAGIIRSSAAIGKAVSEAALLTDTIRERIGADSVSGLSDCFRLLDNCITHYIYLSAVGYYIENGGRSRGSYLVTDDTAGILNPVLAGYDRDAERMIAEVTFRNGKTGFRLEPVRDIPVQELWFEKVWKDYLQDIKQV